MSLDVSGWTVVGDDVQPAVGARLRDADLPRGLPDNYHKTYIEFQGPYSKFSFYL
jgi:hypothetical protein